MSGAELRVGIDVGATNAHAVFMDGGGRLLARAKVPVGRDLRASLDAVLAELLGAAPDAISPGGPVRVTLGTRRVTDALAQRRGLTRVAVLRLGSPLTGGVPPLWTWPAELRAAVSAGEQIVGGGAEYDGRTPTPLDVDAVRRFLHRVAGTAEAVAVSGVFSPISPEQELAVADLVRRELGSGLPVSASHEIGSFGLLTRENATVLNATLIAPVQAVATALTGALRARDIAAETYFAQNDGSVMALEHALRFPVLMIGSGAALSIRGAAQLSGVADGVVVDVGGTRTEVSVLVHGFPREAAPPTEVAGVHTDFPLPEVWTLPVGAATADGGGDALAWELEDVDVLGGDAGAPVVAVGGGAALVEEALPGDHEVVLPAHGDVAGAIGAAIAPVSGRADVVCDRDSDHLDAALLRAHRTAVERAIHAGADPARVEIVEVEQMPLSYLVEPAFRVRVRATGPCV
ncbi:MAG TPA: hydantoinase/oxoprolinase N-terminal domain-containing protein [Baekduia sp.]|uniref:hydantoinase/oxoprolinase N-terminal domain-containing protein n=1 Tax=Baekduia sp. TaxID=2600305 RepID=UPI002B62EF9C|nr:hydantoinase/oxoprolinase N-terminal domain-containing protein [Baekduia sp.]HMJ35861.1 hydantoinase/oxoprolinase N-terminal domain-containing protein [Baekduia sp.]